MNTKLMLLALIFFITIVSCKKENTNSDFLPPITETGANTFGCKINGKVWLPYYKCDYFTNPCAEIETHYIHQNIDYFLPLSFGLGTERKVGSSHTTFSINNLHFGQPFVTTLIQGKNIFDSLLISYNDEKNYQSFGYQNQSKDSKNNFTISKLDTINKIISGTFSFILRNYPDSVLVTDGRFDFKIQDFCKCSKQ